MKKSIFHFSLVLVAIASTAGSALAHFPWLVREHNGKLVYYFGEGIADRNYKLPPSLVETKVVQHLATESRKNIEMTPANRDGFVGLESGVVVELDRVYTAKATFGIYHGSKLDYYTYHMAGKLNKSKGVGKSNEGDLDLSVELIDTDSGVDCIVKWRGEALKGAEVHLYCAEGHEEATCTTDSEGRVAFTDEQVEDGLNGIMVGHKVSEPGKWKDESFETQSHYLTATFLDPETNSSSTAPSKQEIALPKIPVDVTSFGAVRNGDSVYMYGGHTGAAHSYSLDSQNDKLFQLDLAQPSNGWKEIATGPKLQGLGMVAHDDKLILVGGFTALNAEGAEHDLRSQSDVHVFDLKTRLWTKLPSLPEPRSSHDAALIGSKLFVVGGWNMQGKGNTQWHVSALSIDLAESNPTWTELPKPPFVRRALATVAHDNKLFVIGGMNEKGGPTREVQIFDPAKRSWADGGSLQGEKPMAGFGASGWSIDGRLIVTTYEGSIEEWDAASATWSMLGTTKDARFFHRMFALDNHRLVSIGGASMGEGKFSEPEVISVPAKKGE